MAACSQPRITGLGGGAGAVGEEADGAADGVRRESLRRVMAPVYAAEVTGR
ncbi:hypothetical protein GCM10027060_06800 [Nesterenkonia halophila]